MIVYLLGTKAQYIKMAPVILETVRRGLPYRLVLTGQHSETFDDLQRNFGLPVADHVLVPGVEADSHGSFRRWIFAAWRAAQAENLKATWRDASVLVVHGDTASTLLGALIARRMKIPLAHVEAGLRSFDYFHPFPEELIRVVVSRFTRIHFCPDTVSQQNLLRARARGAIVMTQGNTLKDAVRLALQAARDTAGAASYAVFSMHRHENLFDRARLQSLLGILEKLSALIPVKFVLHPVTRKRLEQLGLMPQLQQIAGLQLIPRMDFFSFIALLRGASFVATDGGSNQEECAMLSIPCVLMRKATERQDGLSESVVIGDVDEGVILGFARSHAGATQPRGVDDDQSPSRAIVDHLAEQAGRSG